MTASLPTGRPRFHSLLFRETEGEAEGEIYSADFFRDLSLDRIIDAITADWREYDLAPLFRSLLSDPATIRYRQEIMRDLDGGGALPAVRAFSERMRALRVRLENRDKSYYPHEKQYWFLAACDSYCTGVEALRAGLGGLDLGAAGLRALRDALADYADSAGFVRLRSEMRRLQSDLGAIRYGLLIHGPAITVRPYDGGDDYSAAVEETFAKFRRDAARNRLVESPEQAGMNHVEAQIVERVALLFPEVFGRLRAFCAEHADFQDRMIARCDRDVQFYLAFLRYVEKFRRAGLRFCYPELSRRSKEIAVEGAFDAALAGKLVDEKTPVVCNDLRLSGRERIQVVTGPNQGGKTTFARMFGQLHYLARLGVPVPGASARLFLCDRLFTHFERQEDIGNQRGKLQDDLVRIRRILERATPDSIVIMNEIFSSTTLRDAVYLGRKIMTELSRRDMLALLVTFLDELTAFDGKTVSLVGSASQADPSLRTYRVERRPAEGLAYALAIAEKHGVTRERLKARIQP